MKRFRGVALAVVLVLVTASCSRSGSPSAESASSSGPPASASGSKDATAIANGGFGDLTKVCAPGDAKGASDKGVSDTDIHIATVTDKGFTGRAGLNKEMVDATTAMASWCNEHGGILGRHVVIDDRDAKLTDYNAVVTSSCDEDLAMVGGGAVFDDGDNGLRVQCGLPSIPGFVVTPTARVEQLQVQPLPNPVYKFAGGALRSIDRISQGAFQSVSVPTGTLKTTETVRDATVEAIGIEGGKVVDSPEYNPNGEDNWSPFVTGLKDKNVKAMLMVGEPENLGLFEKAMATDNYYPDVILETPNYYDTKLTDTGGDAIKNTYVALGFVPFEKASENKATQDYLDIMKQYNPSGKVAALGLQATSSFLLFAKAATDCGANLTRTCLMEKAKAVTSWTGGGLHGETSPGTNGPTNCFLIMKASASGFEYDQAATAPNKGLYNCDPSNTIDLKNDYGVPRNQP
jgi:ABC-type branched-subunit amino acid transport system substrate-binding protein